jgi:hypothetical protein
VKKLRRPAHNGTGVRADCSLKGSLGQRVVKAKACRVDDRGMKFPILKLLIGFSRLPMPQPSTRWILDRFELVAVLAGIRLAVELDSPELF